MRLSREFLFFPDFWTWILPKFRHDSQAISFLQTRYFPQMPYNTIKDYAARARRGEVAARRPSFWSWPDWPSTYPGNPEIPDLVEAATAIDRSRRQNLVANAPGIDVERRFPPPHGTPTGNMITDATGKQLGEETAVRALDPRFATREVPTKFDDLADGFIRAQQEKKLHERSQFMARVDLRHVNLPVLIMQHTDVHWGSEDTDYEAIRRHIRILREGRAARSRPRTIYAFGTGDLQEFAKLKHRGAVDGQIHAPTVQARAARASIVESWDAWLAWCLGNHDMRVYLESGFDIGEYLFGEPPHGQPPLPLLRDGGYVYIEHGAQVYTHNIFHGDSAFGTRNNENHKGRQTARYVDGRFDVTWNGHTHNPSIQDTSEPSDDGGGARDAAYMQGGSYKVKGDDHARRRKYLMVPDVQMPAVVQFPDAHVIVPFKRVEIATFFHKAVVDMYEAGATIRDVIPMLEEI